MDQEGGNISTVLPNATLLPGVSTERQQVSEALRRRIELYLHHLHEGVAGSLAIAYLRQIADDEDDLIKLSSPSE
jgi:hypothetical protein